MPSQKVLLSFSPYHELLYHLWLIVREEEAVMVCPLLHLFHPRQLPSLKLHDNLMQLGALA